MAFLLKLLKQLGKLFLFSVSNKNDSTYDYQWNNEPESVPMHPAALPPEPPKYQWDTPEHIRHSIRVICDEEGLTLEQKNTMVATIAAESGFKLDAINYNKRNGKVVSTDYGLCQWNDYYHGKEISPDEALNDPEKAVRLMAKYWLNNQRNLWVAYKSGAYKRYL